MKKALITMLAVGLMTLPPGIGAGKAASSRYTQLRITLTSSSDWASVDVLGSRVVALRVTDQSAGSTTTGGWKGFGVNGSGDGWAVAELIVEVQSGDQPVLRLRKGWLGEASAELERVTSGPETLVTLLNQTTRSPYTTSVALDPADVVGPGIDTRYRDGRRLTLAWYYPWFSEKSFESGSWPDTPRDPEDTTDPDEVGRMIELAAANGVDGFLASWTGSDRVTERVDILFAEASARDFYVAPAIEVKIIAERALIDVVAVEREIRRALSRSANPAYLHVGARPVAVLYRPAELSPHEWSVIRQRLAADGLNPFFVGNTFDSAYDLDGAYNYNPNGMEPAQLRGHNVRKSEQLRLEPLLEPSLRHRLWAATVSPGLDTRSALLGQPLMMTGEYRDREGGARYDQTWSAALASSPDWVFITSWNEWYEATHVAPSTNYGDAALRQTAAWSETFESR